MSCQCCKQERWNRKEKKANEVMKKYGFKDLYNNGFGWWSSIERMADIMCRQFAWASLRDEGITAVTAHTLGMYSFSPISAKRVPTNEFIYLRGVGKTISQKISELPEYAEGKWQASYLRHKSYSLELATEYFHRRKY